MDLHLLGVLRVLGRDVGGFSFMKFGRTYTMIVEGVAYDEDGNHIAHNISFPLTCIFQIVKQVSAASGDAIFRIYNLDKFVRNDLFQDTFQQGEHRQITFAAGYQTDSLIQVFQGNVKQAFSYRQGPDWITEIEAWDGGSAIENVIANITKSVPYSVKDAARDIIGQFQKYNVLEGALGDLDSGVLIPRRGITLVGNAWDLITRSIRPMGGWAFINNQKVNIINQWEYIAYEGGIDEINYDTGMIGTPRLQNAVVKVKLIYEPKLEPGQAVHLTTQEGRLTGDFQVLKVIHQGTISGSVCEELITEVTLFKPNRKAEEVVPLAVAGVLA